jgi:hypothetical protein
MMPVHASSQYISLLKEMEGETIPQLLISKAEEAQKEEARAIELCDLQKTINSNLMVSTTQCHQHPQTSIIELTFIKIISEGRRLIRKGCVTKISRKHSRSR